MPFVVPNQDERDFLNVQAVLDPRIVGLLHPVLVDRRLEELIRSKWQDDEKKDLLRELFRDGGALGAFQTRIQIGFAIGLYDEVMLSDLKLVARIRNAFAHQLKAKSFDDPPVCDYARSLKLPDLYPKEGGALSDPVVISTTGTREEVIGRLMRTSGLVDLQPYQHRFMRAVEIILTWFSIQAGDFSPPL